MDRFPRRRRNRPGLTRRDAACVEYFASVEAGARCPVCHGAMRQGRYQGSPAWVCDCPPPSAREGVRG